jgi:hypothetical protein
MCEVHTNIAKFSPAGQNCVNLGIDRAVARTEMGGFWTNRFVENGFYLKRVSLGLGNLENGLKLGITRINF